ncbi:MULTISPECIES: DUF998 domain-containing protein [Enterococcus]|uniref:DUF998 domain-containing protein n=1 Tax=Enterococcus TaxID=1350 RepID=UPI000EBB3B8C|nr:MULTISPECIES: DUF998 domain-containing protein [Enterococcus]HCM87146.1 DUF998 domain-containing protein [Enterococcus sp.]
MGRSRIQWLGLLGVISFLSYTAAVFLSPLAYPGYDWMAQAVSDLSASNAPSRVLWGQLSALYNGCGLVSITLVFIFVQGKLTKLLRSGIYFFTAMNWVSGVGYQMFPLTDSGYAGEFQDQMHVVVTVLVILLSIISLVLIIIGGIREKSFFSLAIWAGLALVLMIAGAVGINVVPIEYFGIPERFSVFAATLFNAVLGVYLFNGFNIADK